ncbi:hypothetical protein [Runella sp.]|uniref:hypothetical protein n=1 Tax=Runella sp. TaxID=1960881 RepID=UPI00301A08B6
MFKRLFFIVFSLLVTVCPYAQTVKRKFHSSASGKSDQEINTTVLFHNDKSREPYQPDSVKVMDQIPPVITVTEPKNLRGVAPTQTQDSQILVKGTAIDANGIKSVRVNGQSVGTTPQGAFSHTLTLTNGSNALWIEAEDTYGNKAQVQYAIERQTAAVITLNTPKATFGTYHALLIAVKDYQDPRINDLQRPIADVTKVRQSLLNRYTFLPKNITLLPNPTLKQLADTLSKYRRQLTAQDNLLILFCGHGQYDKDIEQGYWLLSDAQTGSPTTWLSNASLRDYLRGIKTQHTLIVSDACFSGSLLLRNSPSIDAATVPIQEIHKLRSRRGMTSGALTTVPDESVFIEYFLNRLNTNPKSFLPSQELFNSFYQDVIQQTKFVPQTGGISGTDDDGGDFIFVKK